jgi:hypothetical protein
MVQMRIPEISLMIFHLSDLPIDESEALKSPTVIISGTICPFMSSSILMIAPTFAACIFINVVSSPWIVSFIDNGVTFFVSSD